MYYHTETIFYISPIAMSPDMNRDELNSALRALPQYSRILPEDAQRWIDQVGKNDPQRLLWHIERLGAGFGGSEMGALILDLLDRTAPFQSAAQLQNQKLMRATPDPSNRYTRRGTVLEKAVIAATLRLYGGSFDQQTADAMAAPHPNDPTGLAGQIDFPWLMRDGRRALVDVKVPGSGEHDGTDNEKTFCYATQLNTYEVLAQARKLPKFDALINIHLELPEVVSDAFVRRLESGKTGEFEKVVEEMVQLVRHQKDGLQLKFEKHESNPMIDVHGVDQPLHDLIKSTAAMYWQSVLDGVVPEVAPQPASELATDQQIELQTKEESLLQLEALSQALESRIAELRGDIQAICSVKAEGNFSQTGDYSIKQSAYVDAQKLTAICDLYGGDLDALRCERSKILKSDIDTDSMIEELEGRGLSVNDFLKPSAFDPQKVSEYLVELGENPEQVVSNKLSIRRSTRKATREAYQSAIEARADLIDAAIYVSANPELEQEPEVTKQPQPGLTAVVSR